jgi:nucleoside-diphosphate-sugar epimerase
MTRQAAGPRLLVTGASGLIGGAIVRAAIARGMDVTASARHRPADLPPLTKFVAADLLDLGAAAGLIEIVAPTHVIHAAWETRRPTYWEDPANLDWALSAARMAQAFARNGGLRFVLVGTCASYDWSYGLCREGVTPDRPSTRYGAAKSVAFQAIQLAAREQFEACDARVFLLYGPGEEETRYVPLICRSHIRGVIPPIGNGRQVRDLLHVDDVAGALLALVEADGLTGVVNLGSGEPVTLAEVSEVLRRIAGTHHGGLGSKDTPGSEAAILAPDVSRLKSIGWTPSIRLEQGLAQTYEWWQARMSSDRPVAY